MEDFQKRVLYEDNHILAFNKKVSEIVQEDKTGDLALNEQLKLWLKKKYNKPGNVFLGVVHRIDRPVSGLVLFAKTSKALSRLNEMLRNKEIKKTYLAITKNPPPEESDRLIHHIYRDTKKNKSFAYSKKSSQTKEAVLDYRHLGKSKSFCLLEINLITGRHHQIRAQLSKINCPIRGDLKYGFPRSNPDSGIDLHAHKISFIHPVKKENMEIIAPVPQNSVWKYFDEAIKSYI